MTVESEGGKSSPLASVQEESAGLYRWAYWASLSHPPSPDQEISWGLCCDCTALSPPACLLHPLTGTDCESTPHKLPAALSPSHSLSHWESNWRKHINLMTAPAPQNHSQYCGKELQHALGKSKFKEQTALRWDNLLSFCPLVSTWMKVTFLARVIPDSRLTRVLPDGGVWGKVLGTEPILGPPIWKTGWPKCSLLPKEACPVGVVCTVLVLGESVCKPICL